MAADPASSDWNHRTVQANGIEIHYVRHGPDAPQGPPLVLLHGWPEFWFTWRKSIPVLAETFDLIAPDLRGFGDSEKPATVPRLDDYADDLLALLDALEIERAGVVAHDVGAYVAQAATLAAPERIAGLFFFNCPYPGIGKRWVAPRQVNEIWYQSFNQLDWAPELLRSSREACRIYFRNLMDHWSGETDAFADDLEAWIDNFLKPGNLEGGFAWYKSVNPARLALIRYGAVERPKIEARSFFLWGEKDPVLRSTWTDALADYFSDFTVETVPDAGHFVHYQKPELTNARIRAFFSRPTES
ncbi:MAG: alpha/beta hydrolase [Hyphomicrobiales bacterium]|nr:alpha/beta hydrolase [Hyphomicrobiales bacterium]